MAARAARRYRSRICATLVRQTTNAQPVTITAPQMAIAAAQELTGNSATASATNRDEVWRYPA